MALRVAVIGVGHLGKHHARILASLPGVELVAVVDTNRARAEEIAAANGTRPAFDAGDVLGSVDAVTVAVPTEIHRAVVLPFLQAGIPVLVEKPIARSLEEADEMIDAGGDNGALLAVGHTERFNPALAVARPHLTDPRFIEVHRLGTFPERSLDIDVVFDLMIHDLDVVLSIVNSDVESLEAVGVPVVTNRVDIANARLRFANGCIVNLTASRISREQVRKIRFFQTASYVSIDYAAQKVEMWRLVTEGGPTPFDGAQGRPFDAAQGRPFDGAQGRPFDAAQGRPFDAAQGRPSIQGGELEVATEEPLKRELVDFVAAIASRRAPVVTGEAGRRALEVAQAITDKIQAGI